MRKMICFNCRLHLEWFWGPAELVPATTETVLCPFCNKQLNPVLKGGNDGKSER